MTTAKPVYVYPARPVTAADERLYRSFSDRALTEIWGRMSDQVNTPVMRLPLNAERREADLNRIAFLRSLLAERGIANPELPARSFV